MAQLRGQVLIQQFLKDKKKKHDKIRNDSQQQQHHAFSQHHHAQSAGPMFADMLSRANDQSQKDAPPEHQRLGSKNGIQHQMTPNIQNSDDRRQTTVKSALARVFGVSVNKVGAAPSLFKQHQSVPPDEIRDNNPSQQQQQQLQQIQSGEIRSDWLLKEQHPQSTIIPLKDGDHKKPSVDLAMNALKRIQDAQQSINQSIDSQGTGDKHESGLLRDYLEDDLPNVEKIAQMLPITVLNPYSNFMKIWNLIMIVLLVYNGLVIPPRLAFDDESGINWRQFDIFVDSLFMIDIIVNFLSAFEDTDGQIVYTHKEIAINYMTGWFLIDVSSTFPLYLVMNQDQKQSQSQNYNNVLRLSRLPRIYKLAKVFRVLKFMQGGLLQRIMLFLRLNEQYMTILKFLTITLVLVHTTGCLWYFLASMNPDDNWVTQFGIQEDSVFRKYIASVYFVLTVLVTVGYGNIVPYTTGEYAFVILLMFFFVMIFSYIMGVLTFQFSKLNEKAMQIKEREVYFNELAAHYKFPIDMHENLIRAVQICVNSTTNTLLETYQKEAIFEELPPSLQGDVCLFLFSDVIANGQFFQDRPKDFIRKLFHCFKPVFLNPGDELYHKGEVSQELYFVVSGRIVTKFQDLHGNTKSLVYVPGSYFGEVDIIFRRERVESAYAQDRCEIWKVEKEDFIMLIEDFEAVKREIIKTAVEKNRFLFGSSKKRVPRRTSYVPKAPVSEGAQMTLAVPQQDSENLVAGGGGGGGSGLAGSASPSNLSNLQLPEMNQTHQVHVTYAELNKRAKVKMLEKLQDEDNLAMTESELQELLHVRNVIAQTRVHSGLLQDPQGERVRDNEIEEIIQIAQKLTKACAKLK